VSAPPEKMENTVLRCLVASCVIMWMHSFRSFQSALHRRGVGGGGAHIGRFLQI
jgi:hypothetical protein